LTLNTGEKIILDIPIAERHRVGILQRDPFATVEEIAGFPVFECRELLIGNSALAADRSVEVSSEYAAIQYGNPSVE
jgi:hypothetical protein